VLPASKDASRGWIAVVGDVHGALDELAELLERFELASGHPVDLILQVGDLEPHRDERDLETLVAPDSKRPARERVGDFPRYAAGAARLPAEVVFIGGNHEPWGFLEERASGEIAPGFTFLGRAGKIERLGLAIAGLSGIHHPRHSARERERAGWERATYFSREDVATLLALDRVDVLLLHDWPAGLLEEKDRPRLPGLAPGEPVGSEPARLLVERLRPSWVFCGHRHVPYARDWDLGGFSVRVRCLADVPDGGASSVLFLRKDGRDLAECAPLEELEALALAGTSGRRRPQSRKRGVS
jgi:hypothetical protein